MIYSCCKVVSLFVAIAGIVQPGPTASTDNACSSPVQDSYAEAVEAGMRSGLLAAFDSDLHSDLESRLEYYWKARLARSPNDISSLLRSPTAEKLNIVGQSWSHESESEIVSYRHAAVLTIASDGVCIVSVYTIVTVLSPDNTCLESSAATDWGFYDGQWYHLPGKSSMWSSPPPS